MPVDLIRPDQHSAGVSCVTLLDPRRHAAGGLFPRFASGFFRLQQEPPGPLVESPAPGLPSALLGSSCDGIAGRTSAVSRPPRRKLCFFSILSTGRRDRLRPPPVGGGRVFRFGHTRRATPGGFFSPQAQPSLPLYYIEGAPSGLFSSSRVTVTTRRHGPFRDRP